MISQLFVDVVVGVCIFLTFVAGAVFGLLFMVSGDPLNGMRALILFALVMIGQGYFNDKRS